MPRTPEQVARLRRAREWLRAAREILEADGDAARAVECIADADDEVLRLILGVAT